MSPVDKSFVEQMGTILIRQHEDSTPPGLLEEWLRERGYAYEIVLSHKEYAAPDPSKYGFVASLGSPYSPNDVHVPAVVRELEVIGAAVEAEVPVLGLCFGGEVLSAVMGGDVGRSPEPELGWREIQTDDPAAVPAGPWLEWHYDSFTTPPGAIEVARTGAAVQAFRKGPHLGVQFHPESTVEIVSVWAEMDAERLSSIGIDDWRPLLDVSTEQREAARRSAFRFFDAFVSEIEKHREKVPDR